MKLSKKKEQPQLKLGLKFSGIRALQQFSFRFQKKSAILNQFTYWRSPLLWFVIFINSVLSFLISSWFYGNIDGLPAKVPLLYYTQESSIILIDTASIPLIVTIQVALQAVTVLLAARLFRKLRPLSTFLLIVSVTSTAFIFAAICKSLSLALP